MSGLERYLQEFERDEFGTNDWENMKEIIRERNWQAAQDNMTGMDEEQADWDAE